jgi:hypothetical protein
VCRCWGCRGSLRGRYIPPSGARRTRSAEKRKATVVAVKDTAARLRRRREDTGGRRWCLTDGWWDGKRYRDSPELLRGSCIHFRG